MSKHVYKVEVNGAYHAYVIAITDAAKVDPDPQASSQD